MTNCRPISICNTIYKKFSKFLVNHLKPLLEKIIIPTQKGFVLGHHILDATITTHEILYSMDRHNNANMSLKLDILKAYDNVIWDFIPKFLAKFGFDHGVVNLLMECITIVRYLMWLMESPLASSKMGEVSKKVTPSRPIYVSWLQMYWVGTYLNYC